MVAKNIHILEERISSACLSAKRNRNEVKLIAVSKTYPVSEIENAFKFGLVDFGENRAQELNQKSELFDGAVNWHFIGHLQTNKVKYVIKPAEYIHSVESKKLADEINLQAEKIGKIQKILLEFNASDEESKYGLKNEYDLFELAEYCKGKSNIKLAGLMTMAPFTDDQKIIRQTFSKVRELKEKMNNEGFELNELSMGMTNDFEIAIEEGSTMLRIGTAIFGDRG
ncbi:MAG: YggS family pyridoxal phosphate-dependent enzyme [Ignavibacteriales bacterium CG_4_9_14_3_um_filter_34_10]|nr:MAG: YggS family pyridoxal phosphate-dependent enzyme [Ignavibacteriales bacterium CG_4_9_14_3_um_filter_34_10]